MAVLVTTIDGICLVKDIFTPFKMFGRHIGGNEISADEFLELMNEESEAHSGCWGKTGGGKVNISVNLVKIG